MGLLWTVLLLCACSQPGHGILGGMEMLSVAKEQRYRFFKEVGGVLMVKRFAVRDFLRDFTRVKVDDPFKPGEMINQYVSHRDMALWTDTGTQKWKDDDYDYELIAVSAELLLRKAERLTAGQTCLEQSRFRTHFPPVTAAARNAAFVNGGKELLKNGFPRGSSGWPAVGCNYKLKLTCEQVGVTDEYKCTHPMTRTLSPGDTERKDTKHCHSDDNVLPHYVNFKDLMEKAREGNPNRVPRNMKPFLTVIPAFRDRATGDADLNCPPAAPFCSFIRATDMGAYPYFKAKGEDEAACLTFDLNHPQFLKDNAHVTGIQSKFTLNWGEECDRDDHDKFTKPEKESIRLEHIHDIVTRPENAVQVKFCKFHVLLVCGDSSIWSKPRCTCLRSTYFYHDGGASRDLYATGGPPPPTVPDPQPQPPPPQCQTLPFLASCNDGAPKILDPDADPTTVEGHDWFPKGVVRTGTELATPLFQLRLTMECMATMYCKGASGYNLCYCEDRTDPHPKVAGWNCVPAKAALMLFNHDKYIPQIVDANGVTVDMPQTNQIARLRPYNQLNDHFTQLEARMKIPINGACKLDFGIDTAMMDIRTLFIELKKGQVLLSRYDTVFLEFEKIHRADPMHDLCAISYDDAEKKRLSDDPILICRYGLCRRIGGYDDLDELMFSFEIEFRTLYRKGLKPELKSGPCDVATVKAGLTVRRQLELDKHMNTYLNIDRSVDDAGKAARKEFAGVFEKFMNDMRDEGREFCRTELGLSCVLDPGGQVPYCGCLAPFYVPFTRTDDGQSEAEKLTRGCSVDYSQICDLCIPHKTVPDKFVLNVYHPCSKMATEGTTFGQRGYTIGTESCREGSECRLETHGDLPNVNNPVPDAKYCRRKADENEFETLKDPSSHGNSVNQSALIIASSTALIIISTK